jgi:hypothetical protein
VAILEPSYALPVSLSKQFGLHTHNVFASPNTILSPMTPSLNSCPLKWNSPHPPSLPLFDPAIILSDQDGPPDAEPSSAISPANFAAALRLSTQAFRAMAMAHKAFMTTITEERLNKHGSPKNLALDDRVKIYVPPTHVQILKSIGRRSNHIPRPPGCLPPHSHPHWPYFPQCVPEQCTTIAVQQYKKQYNFVDVCALAMFLDKAECV